MNVTVDILAPCKKLVRVEVEAAKVDETFAEVAKGFAREAAFPGFRPGKAPREMVLRRYEQEIKDETKRKLISDSYAAAIKEQKLRVLGYPDIEEVQFKKGEPLQFNATVETAPEFELPEYKGIAAKREARTVTDQDVEHAILTLREKQADIKKVERPGQTGDIAVVNYAGTVDGKPITDIVPTAKGLTTQQGFWIELSANSFIPGFGDQLIGSKPGDKRTVTISFPADFVTPELVGKQGVYEVEVVEIREKVLPVVDEAFAKSFGAESLEKLMEGVRKDLENELKFATTRSIRNQVIRSLMDSVNFDLPESAVANETKNVVYDIVQENQKRGISRELIEKEKEQIFSAATSGAKERVKVAFLLSRIAEKEAITISRDELITRVVAMANSYQIPPEKFFKDLEKKNALSDVANQVLNEKVVDMLETNARIEEVPAGQLSAPKA